MLPLAAGATRREEGDATVMAKGTACTSILHVAAYSDAHARPRTCLSPHTYVPAQVCPRTCMSSHISLTVHRGDGHGFIDVETKV